MSNKAKNSRVIDKKTLMLAQMSVLTAVIFVLDATKLGYLPFTLPGVSVMMIPVSIAAMIMGRTGGAIMGLMFGISSMLQCFTGNTLGALAVSINLPFTIVLNVGTRVLVGFLTGCIFRLLNKLDKSKLWSYGVTACLASVLNSVIYVPLMVFMFGSSPEFQELFTGGAELLELNALLILVIGILAVSAIFEAVACTIVGGSVGKILNTYVNKS